MLQCLACSHTAIRVVGKQLHYHLLYLRMHVRYQLGYACAFLLREIEFHVTCKPVEFNYK